MTFNAKSADRELLARGFSARVARVKKFPSEFFSDWRNTLRARAPIIFCLLVDAYSPQSICTNRPRAALARAHGVFGEAQ